MLFWSGSLRALDERLNGKRAFACASIDDGPGEIALITSAEILY